MRFQLTSHVSESAGHHHGKEDDAEEHSPASKGKSVKIYIEAAEDGAKMREEVRPGGSRDFAGRAAIQIHDAMFEFTPSDDKSPKSRAKGKGKAEKRGGKGKGKSPSGKKAAKVKVEQGEKINKAKTDSDQQTTLQSIPPKKGTKRELDTKADSTVEPKEPVKKSPKPTPKPTPKPAAPTP